MKTSASILATIALLVVAALGVPGTHADQSTLSNNTHAVNVLLTSQHSYDEKASWAPLRTLRVMDSPQQGPMINGKKKHHHHHHPKDASTKQTSRALFEETVDSSHRVLGQAPVVTPASTTTGNSKPTPAPTKPHTQNPTHAPTKPHTPKVTPAATKTTSSKPKVTPVATTTTTKKPKATPAATKTTQAPTKSKPKPAATKSTTPKTTPAPTVNNGFDPVQQKIPNLGDDQAKQQQSPPSDHAHGGKPVQKNGKEHN